MKKNYRAVIQYEGTKYQGWQKQKSTQNTIQQKLEDLLTRLDKTPVEVFASGRTDAGVHAYGQVISFRLNTEMKTEQIMEYMNRYLPEDIGVISLVKASDRFHARLNAVGKIYEYRVITSSVPHVFDRRYTVSVERKPDLDAIRKAIGYLQGTHDFQGFTSKKNSKKSTVRTIHSITIEEKEDELKFIFYGDGFLYHMVRILMGTLLEIGAGERQAESILRIFEEKDRAKAGFLAPAKGLALVKVFYD